VVLFHHVLNCSLARVSLNKLRINLKAFLSVLQCAVELHELDIGSTPVGVDIFVVGVSPQALTVLLNSIGEVTSPKELITFQSVLLSLFTVKILLGFLLFLRFFSFLQLFLDHRVIMFEKCTFVQINCFSMLT
jgi:hypothetical protein